MVIKINYTSSDIYVSTNVSPIYVVVNYSAINNGGGVAWGAITGTLSNQTDLQTALDAKVPYTGATTNVNLGEFALSAGQLTLDTSPTGTAAVATTRWNDTTGVSETTLKGGSVILKNGVDLVARVVNKVFPNATLTKAAYQAVRVSGAQGQRLAVAYAQANNDANSADTIGLVCETIATNQEGFIITVGQLENINTTGSLQGETWVDGDVLYLSPTTAGAITKVKPTGNGHIVIIGYVEYAHVNNGKIYVKVMNGWELDELHDVSIVTPANNEALIYESSTALWKNKTIATALGYTPISGTGATGQVAYWNGTNSQTGSNNLFWDAANSRLGIGTNAPAALLDIRGSISIGASSATTVISTYNSTTRNRITYTLNSSFEFFEGANERMRLAGGSGNLLIGGTTDGGQRLQVYGDAFIKGSATSATDALLIQNNSSNQLFRVSNSGGAIITAQTNTEDTNTLFNITRPNGGKILSITDQAAVQIGNTNFIVPSTGINGVFVRASGGLFIGQNNASNPTQGYFNLNIGRPNNIDNQVGATIEQGGLVQVIGLFNPNTAVSTPFTSLYVRPTINQTGGANGITRGLYVNPTLTAAADWRSIEWSNNSGWGLYGAGTAANYLGGTLTASSFIKSGGTSSQYLMADGSTSTLTNPVTGTGTTNFLPKWTSSSAIGNSIVSEGSNVINVNGDLTIPVFYAVKFGGSSAAAYMGDFNNDGSIQFATSSATKMRLDSSGNLGLGVTPSAWWVGVNVFELPNGVSFFGNTSVSGSSITTNAFFNTSTTWIYKTSAQATKYDQYQGQHQWYNAASGTAGNAISFSQVMTLTNNGYLLVGTTTDNGNRLQVSGNGYFSGNVGIGTASPLTLIHIEGTNPVFTLKATNGSTDQKILYLQNSAGALNFSKANDAYNSFTTLMQLTNGGNLGIGSTSPTAALDTPASTTARATMRIRSGVAPTSPNDGDIWFDGTDLKMRIGGVTKTFTLI